MLNNKTILNKINALNSRYSPLDCISVASISAFESEREAVDVIFLGKKWNEVDIERIKVVINYFNNFNY